MMRVGVLVSGAGTNLQALLDAERRGALAPAEIACVISSRARAVALERASTAGKPALAVEPHQHGDRDAWEAALVAALRKHGVEAVVLAGFMRVLGPGFLAAFPGRVINTHPSLLPAFPGLDACGQAIAHGVKVSGCTVHFVDAGVDSGPIIAQRAVVVRPDDDPAKLQARIQRAEHQLLPAVVAALADGRIHCRDRVVAVDDPTGAIVGAEDPGGSSAPADPLRATVTSRGGREGAP